MFGQLVRAHRRRLGLSQEELAERSGISVSGIGKLEAGRIAAPRPSTVRLLADVFGLREAQRDRFCQAAAGAAPADQVGHGVVPAQLPPDVWAFTGRTTELNQLDALLESCEQPSAPMVISAVSGTAGVGKSTLAVRWARQVASRFPDGQLYVNLRGFGPCAAAVDPAEALRGFLDAFGVPPQRIPAVLDARVALYRSLLAGRRVLVVLDNARDADQVRPLLPGSAGSVVVVTSRNRLASLVAVEGAHPITVDLLAVAEARDLLAARMGADRVAAEPDAVDAIIACCARLPLAMAIVAARAAFQPQMPLRTLADQLRGCTGGLDAFAGDDAATDVRAVLSWSYEALSGPAARLFRLLGLHPGPDVSLAALSSLAGLHQRETDRPLTELTCANMVSEPVAGRFALHDLLRSYAAELAHAGGTSAAAGLCPDTDAGTDSSASVRRLLDHYLHTAYVADRLINPQRDHVTLPTAQPGVTPENLAEADDALAWFTTEHQVLLGVVALAVRERLDSHTWLLAWTLAPFFDRRGHWRDWETVTRRALDAVRRLDDRPGQAYTHRSLARVCTRLARYGDAHTHYQQALDLYVELGDRLGQAHTHQNLAEVFENEARMQDALDHTRRAHEMYHATGNLSGQGTTLNAIGWYLAQLDRHQEALDYCDRALTVHQNLGDHQREADTLDSLGYIFRHLGDYNRAITCYEKSIELFRETGSRAYESMVLANLGDAYYAADQPSRARAAWQQALEIRDQLGQDIDQLRARLRDLGPRDE
jgi:tetratricopeptide (TPR) repeat protein/transcriptional regulator with XRE-family HTH domain